MNKLQDQKTKQNLSIPKYKHTELLETLFYIQDVLERAQIPFLVLGETALSIYNNEADLKEPVHIGILKKYLMRANASTVKTLLHNANFTETRIDIVHNNIPIRVDIINQEYSFFKYPDKKFYYIEDFNLPNPFNNYYKVRNAII